MDQINGVSIEEYIKVELDKLSMHACGSNSFQAILRDDCSDEEIRTYFGNSSAWCKVICRVCYQKYGNGFVKWMAKPGNLKPKKSRKGASFYRDWWREKQGGILICWLCEDREDKISNGFQHHHIDWLYEDGTDYPPEEVRMCCSPCHDLLTSIKRLMKNKASGRIKRDWCGADDVLCSANINCNHEDRENCESRIERQ